MAFTPLRTIDELEQRGIEPDRCFRVRTARVIAADYPQLQADFPQLRVAALGRAHRHLRSLRGRRQEAAVREIIDAWLVRHGGLVTSTQAGQTAINARPEIYPEVVPVHRPPRYGRAVVVSIADSNRSLPDERRSGLGREPDGLLDLKGVGVAPGVALTRRRRLHGLTPLGLCPLGFALSEYSWRLMLDAVFRHAGTEFRALPIYAVIDLGFDDFLGRPAGVLVRRAHRRHPGGHDFFHQIGATTYRIPVMAEMLLRCYGVTTARAPAYVHFEGRGPGRRAARFIVDGQRLQNHTPAEIGELLEVVAPGRRRASFLHLNLQNTSPVQERPPAAQFFDLEVVGASRRFDEPVLMMVGNRPFRWGGTLGPRNAHFIQPDRRYALPLADWGPARATSKELRSLGLPRRSWCAAPLLFGMQLARALRAGTISPARVADRVHGRVERARRRWPRTSDAWRQSFRAADALFESAATTGTRVLGIERDRAVRSSLNAAEGLVAIVDLQTARATATSALTDRHRVHWAARRIMASDAIQRAEGRMTRDAARALRAGDAVTARRLTASLEAGARLRDPASRSIPDLRRDLARLMRAEPVAACVASWLASVRRASRR